MKNIHPSDSLELFCILLKLHTTKFQGERSSLRRAPQKQGKLAQEPGMKMLTVEGQTPKIVPKIILCLKSAMSEWFYCIKIPAHSPRPRSWFPPVSKTKAHVFAKDSYPIRATAHNVLPWTRPTRGVLKIQRRGQTFWLALEKLTWKFSLYVSDLLLSKVGIVTFDFADRGASVLSLESTLPVLSRVHMGATYWKIISAELRL